MAGYNLGFISDEDIFLHVKKTVELYRFGIDLKKFNKNIVDPIKLTFDSKIYDKKIEDIIETECLRQIDKSNTNGIGYFHQNIFNFVGGGWEVQKKGFDVANNSKNIFAEIKNKHNTMNSASSKNTYMMMQQKILKDDKAVCMLVEVISAASQNVNWVLTINDVVYSHERIRRVSMDKFYGIATGDASAFKKLCEKLPTIIDDVIVSMSRGSMVNTVFDELSTLSPNIMKSLFLLAFAKYDGFGSFEV